MSRNRIKLREGEFGRRGLWRAGYRIFQHRFGLRKVLVAQFQPRERYGAAEPRRELLEGGLQPLGGIAGLRLVASGQTADVAIVSREAHGAAEPQSADLTPREFDVLALMAEGRSNTEISESLVITDSAVSKHINSIFLKLGLYPGDTGNRRVLAVLRYLGAAT